MIKLSVAGMALAAALMISTPASAAENLVLNGDFEQTLSGKKIASWTVFPRAEILAATGADYINNAGATGSAAAAANTFAAFGGGQQRNVSSLVSTAFSTVVGQVYELTFKYAQFGGSFGDQVLSYSVLSDNNNTLKDGTETQAGGTNLDTIFKSHRLYFTGDGSNAKVLFSLSGEPTFNVDGLLDNVVITAVPEATTWAMMLLGMAGIGMMLRSRRMRSVKVSFA